MAAEAVEDGDWTRDEAEAFKIDVLKDDLGDCWLDKSGGQLTAHARAGTSRINQRLLLNRARILLIF